MFLQTRGKNLQNRDKNIKLTAVPDVCPLCHRSIHPKHIITQDLEERKLCQAVFRCTNQNCQEIFISTYIYTGRSEGGHQLYDFVRLAPISPQEAEFSETIKEISTSFVDIYNQALSAESHNLNQLVGIGLRKALEFLIKDFAVHQSPANEEVIRASMLGKCINEYIDDTNIKECAKRAAWLGNDETHYTRRWEDKDVKDLKLLVRLTVNWIDNVLLTQKYIEEMESAQT
jgi:hypothetical protein